MPQQYSSQLNLKHFPFVQSDQSEQTILNRNTLNIGTCPGENVPAHGSELLSSPAPVSQSVVVL